MSLTASSLSELRRILDTKEASVQEVRDAHLAEIQRLDNRLGCFLTLLPDADCNHAQGKINRCCSAPLTGIPIGLKDNISTKDVRTTAASRTLENYIPPFDATVVAKLKDQGAVILGKTNLDEFAMGASTEHSAYQITRNPWNLECSPGGSSGGSAAAVAAELVPVTLGSDTGGSIRQPAALCGVVGFKPTYGRCSRYGLIAFASSLDQIGPIARSVEDAALLAEAITGHDPKDSTSLHVEPISTKDLKKGRLSGIKMAIPRELLGESIHAGVLAQMHEAIDKLQREGVEITEIDLPAIKFGVTTYYIIAPAEASSNLARFDGVRFGLRAGGEGHIEMMEKTRAQGFGHEVKARIMMGTYALSAGYYDAYYVKAQQVRSLMRNQMDLAFQSCDYILSPTSPVPAFKLGEVSKNTIALKMLDLCTIPANMGGYPALSLNCGQTEGLPVGLQLIGPTLSDERLLQTSYCVERALGATIRPQVT